MGTTVDTVIDVVFVVGMIGLIAMVMVGWLRSPRPTQTRIVGADSWFFSGSRQMKVVLTLLASVFAVYLGYVLWTPVVSVSSENARLLKLVGLVLYLGGGAFIVWARSSLGTNWAVSTSFGVQLQTDHQLIQRGPFAWVRHPMYVGFWVLLFGALLAYRTWALLILLPMVLASFSFRARREEAALEATFGDEWRQYAAHVGRFLPRPR